MRSMIMFMIFTILLSQSIFSQDFIPMADESVACIADLVLIYQGGTHRPEWTVNDFKPYVYRKSSRNIPEWLFDGFLFIEFKDNRGYEYAYGYKQKPAGKKQWRWLLKRNFQKEKAIDALNNLLDSLNKKGFKPVRNRKVVLTLPEPIVHQNHWGRLKGENMDFKYADDRLSACQWYIDMTLQYWEKANLEHLELAGFYWVAEHSHEATELLQEVSEYISGKGLKFLWIPYWEATGAGEWDEHGFDGAYQQPNHFFNSEIPDKRLEEAITYAKHHGMGLEFEFDNRAANKIEFRDRFYTYFKAFREQGIWDKVAVAYYEGGTGIMNFAKHKDDEVRKMYKDLTDIIVERQLKADKKLVKE